MINFLNTNYLMSVQSLLEMVVDCYILCERKSDFILIVHSEQYIGMHCIKGVECQEAIIPCFILICVRERERGGGNWGGRERGGKGRGERKGNLDKREIGGVV